MAQTFYSQIGANRRNSVLLVVIVLGLFGALGFSIGYAFSGSTAGAAGVTAFALFLDGPGNEQAIQMLGPMVGAIARY